MSIHQSDPVLDALTALARGLEHDIRQDRLAIERTVQIHELRARGLAYHEIAARADRPGPLALVTTNLRLLSELGHEVRVASANALHAEGMTLEEIAHEF